MENYLIKGMVIGLVFGVPAGAIGALTIQRALTHGFMAGLVTGLGSSVADMLYACIGVFGLTVVSDIIATYQSVISLVGGIFIIILGIVIFRKIAVNRHNAERKRHLQMFWGSSFIIAITNPATIISFFIAFATFGIAEKTTFIQGVQLIIGILVGTFCWWCGVAGIVSVFRRRITNTIYQKMNWILGSLMVVFGMVSVIRVFL